MIQLQQVTLMRGSKLLLEKASLTIFPGQKLGLIGLNGAGKTSLLYLLQGDLAADDGELSSPKSLRFAHIKQDIPQGNQSAVEYALEGDQEYSQLMEALDNAEQAQDGMMQAELYAKMADIEGYSAASRAAKTLLGLGFLQSQLEQPVSGFSGGWRMRLNLAQVLLSRADMLLLDEPTNHLDLEGIVWLENWIRETKATVVLISHDRDFLDQVVTDIAHLHHQQLTAYAGNYSSFERQYAQRLALQQAKFEKQQKARAHMQHFVDRFRAKASKARQAQSRLKMLEKMEVVASIKAENPFQFEFFEAPYAGNPMLQLDDVSVGYDNNVVLKNLRLGLREGDRVGLLGLNGAGKSTLIKLLSGKITPMAGEVVRNQKLEVGYFAQHQLEHLDAEASPLLHLQRSDNKITEQQARLFLGRFNFQGDRVFESITNFSGGEKARLALALIIWQKPNLLLLDEPTNHLDMEMRSALDSALQDYNGAIIIVSHDRYLLNSLVDELWLVANHSVTPFEGDLEDYRRWLLAYDREKIEAVDENSANKDSQKTSNKKSMSPSSKRYKLERLEKELANTEKNLANINQQLAAPELYEFANQNKLKALTSEQSKFQKKVNKLEEQILLLLE